MESKVTTQSSVPTTTVPTSAKRPYNLNEELRKEQSTYLGRLKYYFSIISPLQAFIPDKDAQWAKSFMIKYEKEKHPDGTIIYDEKQIKDLRKAHLIYNSVFHPDTKEKVPLAFRMSAFVPTNLPIIFGMMCVPQTLVNVVFFQWVNQTYNACLNYSNRNATSTFTNKELAISYGAAVGSSIGVALVGRHLSNKFGAMSGSISRQRFVNGLVAASAMACAGFLNLYLIRYNEMRKGIQVTHHGKTYGLSKEAAKTAVVKSALTRAVLPIPMVIIIPGLWKIVELCRMVPKSRTGMVLTDMLIVSLQLTVSLPLAISLFTQELTLSKNQLEPEFRNIKDDKGVPIDAFTINKGM